MTRRKRFLVPVRGWNWRIRRLLDPRGNTDVGGDLRRRHRHYGCILAVVVDDAAADVVVVDTVVAAAAAETAWLAGSAAAGAWFRAEVCRTGGSGLGNRPSRPSR